MGRGFAYGSISDIQEFGLASISELTDQTSQSLVVGSQGSPVMPFHLEIWFKGKEVKGGTCTTLSVGWNDQSGFCASSVQEDSICAIFKSHLLC